jgi:hypothetical protein
MFKLPLLLFVLIASIIYQNCDSTQKSSLAKADSNSIQLKNVKRTLYVDANYSGSDSNGNLETPFKKIGDALSEASDNDAIEVAQGKYEESLSIAENVSLIGKVTRNEKNEIIRRPMIVSPDRTVVSITGKHLTFDGFEIIGSTNFDKYDASGNLISLGDYSRSCDSDVSGIYVGEGADDITISQNYIHQIGHDYVFCIEKKEKDCLDHNDDGDHCVYGHGINVNNYSSDKISPVNIHDNVLSNLHLGRSEAITLNGNIYDFTVKDNVIHDVDNIAVDIGGFQETCPETGNSDDCRAIKGSITGNTISKLVGTKYAKDKLRFNPGQRSTFPWEAGIYIDGGTGKEKPDENIIIDRNNISDFGFGVELGSEKPGKDVQYVVVKNNVIKNTMVSGIGVGHGLDVGKTSYSDQRSSVKNCWILNNTVVGNNKISYDENNKPDLTNGGVLRFVNHLKNGIENIVVANNVIKADKSERLIYWENWHWGDDDKTYYQQCCEKSSSGECKYGKEQKCVDKCKLDIKCIDGCQDAKDDKCFKAALKQYAKFNKCYANYDPKSCGITISKLGVSLENNLFSTALDADFDGESWNLNNYSHSISRTELNSFFNLFAPTNRMMVNVPLNTDGSLTNVTDSCDKGNNNYNFLLSDNKDFLGLPRLKNESKIDIGAIEYQKPCDK